MNEPTIHLSVIPPSPGPDPEDQKRQEAMAEYLQWLQKAQERASGEHPFIPLKPRVTRENLWNL